MDILKYRVKNSIEYIVYSIESRKKERKRKERFKIVLSKKQYRIKKEEGRIEKRRQRRIQNPEKISIAYCAKEKRERKNKKYNYSIFILEKKEESCQFCRI